MCTSGDSLASLNACIMQVDDPSKYGVVVTDEASKVERFVEKPKACFLPT